MKPQIFGKYCLLDRISVGGMAEVFRARPFNDRGYTGFLALKRILPHLAEDQEFVKMFLDEATLTTRLHHKNIVRVHELATYRDSNFILMEYICGRDILAIQKAMRRRREICPVDFAAIMIADAVSGLDFAHRAVDEHGESLNIVHRDVSPQNILVQYDGVAKVIDFGIAKAAIQSSKTRVGVVKGKVGYMSPEQVRSETVTRQSDIFSVGVVFWELVTNQRLFKGANEFDTMNMVREAKVEPPSIKNPEIPPELDRIILKSLAVNLDERYATGEEMVNDIHLWLKDRPSVRPQLAKWMQQVFESDVEEERERIERFKHIQNPNDVIAFNRKDESDNLETKNPFDDDIVAKTTLSQSPVASNLETIDSKAYLAFADEQTQIRAGGLNFDDLQLADNNPNEAVFNFNFNQPPHTPTPHPPSAQSNSFTFDSAFVHAEPPPRRTIKDLVLGWKFILIGFVILFLFGAGGAVAAALVLSSSDTNAIKLDGLQASLIVNVSPPQGILISVDGRPVGDVSPVTIDSLSPGKHTLSVRGGGYKTYSEVIDIPKGSMTEKSVVLEKGEEEHSKIRVDVGKLGSSARIFLDGKPQSAIAASDGLEVLPGEHVLEITENGKFPVSNLLTVEPAATLTVTPTLQTTSRRLVFPRGFKIELNDKPVRGNSILIEGTIPQKIAMKESSNALWDGYIGFPELAVEQFNPEKTPQGLSKDDFAWLAVDTKGQEDNWWMVTIDGIPTGFTTPIHVDKPIPVRPGQHTLGLVRAGAKVEIPFEAKPGGSIVFHRGLSVKTDYKEKR